MSCVAQHHCPSLSRQRLNLYAVTLHQQKKVAPVMSFEGRIMWGATCDQGFFSGILCPSVHMPNYSWSARNPLIIDPGSVPCAYPFLLKDERSYPELGHSYQLQTRVHVGRKGTAWRKTSDTTASSEYAILMFSLKTRQVDNISGTEEGNVSQTREHRLTLTTRKFSISGAHTFSPCPACGVQMFAQNLV